MPVASSLRLGLGELTEVFALLDKDATLLVSSAFRRAVRLEDAKPISLR